MYKATIPDNEPMRLATLHASQLLNQRGGEQYHRLTRLGRRLLQMPVCLLNLVDAEYVRVLAGQGSELTEFNRVSSFCGHTILGDDALVIQDTRHHPYFFDNPLVVGPQAVRSYIGMPIRAFNGCKIATLCLMDNMPREVAADDLAALRDLALLTEQELAAGQLAIIDDLTGLVNRRGFETMARLLLNTSERQGMPAVLLYFDLDDFFTLNRHYGEAEGDRMLMRFSRLLRQTFRGSDVLGRLGDNSFAVLVANSSAQQAEMAVERMRQSALSLQQQEGWPGPLLFSTAAVHYAPPQGPSLENLLSRADHLLYKRQQGQRLC
ncbi:MAG: sensor domain-containing diguanylate cyclase [Gammaproteobacteria bacterium]|nr:sensor domain-containing diguanylate cyclase [Gammaproteobacteria bacterium]MBU2223830.1 sensor domain-containing diguanylate cyclase [Gammaproteobacteria bacterium]MBU2279524.1 sensor domain-containing diguanylate cyclase [Gammaproteobacteria bacterium]MBU2426818.1 sensor domain-containing diguanylate cyclase [Gammaproteobacteria bacterium]